MPDMLVKLYELPESETLYRSLAQQGVELRRVLAPEQRQVIEWVREHFGEGWAMELATSCARTPTTAYIAQQDNVILGFACYDAVCKGFFGPTGVEESQRGRGIGKALLFKTLEQMRANGYGYAVIGWVGPADFYAKAVGATIIEGSEPGVYRGLLRG